MLNMNPKHETRQTFEGFFSSLYSLNAPRVQLGDSSAKPSLRNYLNMDMIYANIENDVCMRIWAVLDEKKKSLAYVGLGSS